MYTFSIAGDSEKAKEDWMRRRIVGIFLFALLVIATLPARASTFARVAVGSNILVSGNRVIFIQGTGSVTVLDLETGKVLMRKKLPDGAHLNRTLAQTPHGLLVIGSGRMMLLNDTTLELIWEANDYGAVFDSEFVCSHDGESTVSCRDVKTGKVLWRNNAPEGWQLAAAGGMVAVSTRNSSMPVAAQVFELSSGRSVFELKRPADAGLLQAHFDGERLFALFQSPGRAIYDFEPGELVAYDLRGNEIKRTAFNSPEVLRRGGDVAFIWGNDFFDGDGRIRPATAFDKEYLDKPAQKGNQTSRGLSGGIFECIRNGDHANHGGAILRFTTSERSWSVYAPYLGRWEAPRVMEAQGCVLLASNEGRIECLDAATGIPRWLYAFPAFDQLMSYSSPHGLPPYATQQAAAYRRGVAGLSKASGSLPLSADVVAGAIQWDGLPRSGKYAGNVIIDPSPDDPFSDLWPYVLWAAILAVSPVAIAVILIIDFQRRRASNLERGKNQCLKQAIWSILLSISPAIGLIMFGRVSHGWTLSLKTFFALAMLSVAYAVCRLYVSKRWVSASIAALVASGWVYWMAYPWWYA